MNVKTRPTKPNAPQKEKRHSLRKKIAEATPSAPALPITEASPEEGLSRDAVRERMEKGLVNTPVASPVKSEKQIIRDNCLTFFNLIFLILAVCLALVGSFEDMLFLGIAITNTAIGIFQEIRSKRTIDKMTLVASKKLNVVRGGKIQQIPLELLVRDDIVEFAHGDQICADAVVCTGQVQVNESLITGEADAIVKNPGDLIFRAPPMIHDAGFADEQPGKAGKGFGVEPLEVPIHPVVTQPQGKDIHLLRIQPGFCQSVDSVQLHRAGLTPAFCCRFFLDFHSYSSFRAASAR